MATLVYFDILGFGEPVRMFFAYNKLEYTDKKITPGEWPKMSKELSVTG